MFFVIFKIQDMKKIFIFLILSVVMIVSLQAQSVSNYAFKLDNGITVKMENCWNHVWVSQAYESLKPGDPAVALSPRTLGELTANATFKLLSSGKEVKALGAKPGTYTMKVSFKHTGKPGTISFDIENVAVKAQSKTVVSVIIYDYQINIDEAAGGSGGLAAFTAKVERYKGIAEQNPQCGIPSFFSPGKHDSPVLPVELRGKTGKIKPGSYDLLLTIGSSSRPQKVWLQNFVMKPDISYTITVNLNAGVVEYAGTNREVKAVQMFPAGTADKVKGALPDKNLEVVRCEGLGSSIPCPPGTYDVFLNAANKPEWRKAMVVKTGSRTQVK